MSCVVIKQWTQTRPGYRAKQFKPGWAIALLCGLCKSLNVPNWGCGECQHTLACYENWMSYFKESTYHSSLHILGVNNSRLSLLSVLLKLLSVFCLFFCCCSSYFSLSLTQLFLFLFSKASSPICFYFSSFSSFPILFLILISLFFFNSPFSSVISINCLFGFITVHKKSIKILSFLV